MQAIRLKETNVRGMYIDNDGRVYALVNGAEAQCDRCEGWTQKAYRRGKELICGAHVRIASRTHIRIMTTFACRVYRDGATGQPSAKVFRRGDVMAVASRPERVGGYDKFFVSGGFVLVPRSRWAWE